VVRSREKFKGTEENFTGTEGSWTKSAVKEKSSGD